MTNLSPEAIQAALAANPEWASIMGVDAQGNVFAMQPGQTPTTYAPIGTPTYNPPTYRPPTFSTVDTSQPITSPQQDLTTNPYQALSPVVTGGDPIQAEWEARQNLIARQAENIGQNEALLAFEPLKRAATEGVLSATEQQVALQREQAAIQARYNKANAAVNKAAGAAADATEQQLTLQQQINQDRLAEEIAIQQAEQDTGNILAVAGAQRTRDALKYRFGIAGLPAPIEVKLPPDFEGQLPAGIVARLMTLAEILSDAAKSKDKLRAFELEAARIKTAQAQLRVTRAEIHRGEIAIDLDEAQLAVYKAGLAVATARISQDRVALLIDEAKAFETMGQLAVSRASLALNASQIPPQPGLEWNRFTGQWEYPKEKAGGTQSQTPYGVFSESDLVALVKSNSMSIEDVRAELAARTRADGTPVYSPVALDTFMKHLGSLTGGGGIGGPPGGDPTQTATPPPTVAPPTLPNEAYWWDLSGLQP